MNKLPTTLRRLFRPRRPSGKPGLNAVQAHILRENLRALLLTKETLKERRETAA